MTLVHVVASVVVVALFVYLFVALFRPELFD